MGTLWRSQEMSLAQLFIPAEAAYDVVTVLGEKGNVQFRDLNPDVNAFQRKYVNEVRRADEMERRTRYFEKEIEKAELPLAAALNSNDVPAPDSAEIQTIETDLAQLEREMQEINSNEETLKHQEIELQELRHIMSNAGSLFEESDIPSGSSNDITTEREERVNLLAAGDNDDGNLGFVTGVIDRTRVPGFERLLWRATRGNAFLRRIPVEEPMTDPVSGETFHKDVFIVFFQGEQLEARVNKICEGFDAARYPCPSNSTERREVLTGVTTRLEDLKTVLNRTSEHRRQLLSNVSYKLPMWNVKVKKMKAVYHVMNMFKNEVTEKCLIGECWVPVSDIKDIQVSIREAAQESGSTMPAILDRIDTKENPPTFHKTTKFTSGFQAIVDAYGVASYREVNPGPFTIITFPFLFAVMFGDCGHGLIMFLTALFLVMKEDSLKNFKGGGEIWDTMFGGRYIILLMGMFSIYTGLIYNDCFSKSLTLANSGWSFPDRPVGKDFVDLTIKDNFKRPYELGIDPIWALSDNKLTFTNSYKMKLSVLLGISQMLFGVVLSYFNHSFFKKRINILCEFIPQCLFLFCIFGYLCITILYKWSVDEFPHPGNNPDDKGNPPSLLLMLINMFLKFGAPPASGEVLYGDVEGNTQKVIQMMLVIIAVLCVPWMLLIKPFVLKSRHKAKMTEYAQLNINDERREEEEEEFDFGEIMVHQSIHTIEFCLGCISNTASYLRLWALSLAHAQLSEVLWSMILHRGFGQFAILYCAFTMWAALTIAVLLIMEGLSAFLHALRLHWVEFQNKFYDGNGYKFAPFSFEKVLSGKLDD